MVLEDYYHKAACSLALERGYIFLIERRRVAEATESPDRCWALECASATVPGHEKPDPASRLPGHP